MNLKTEANSPTRFDLQVLCSMQISCGAGRRSGKKLERAVAKDWMQVSYFSPFFELSVPLLMFE
jgi:hypothetical protein